MRARNAPETAMVVVLRLPHPADLVRPDGKDHAVGAVVWSAVGWALTPGQIARLNQASTLTAPYPHFPYQRQEGFARLNPAA